MNLQNNADRTLPLIIFVGMLSLIGFFIRMPHKGHRPDNFKLLSSAPLLDGKPININEASVEQLNAIPQISKRIAQAIVTLREERGKIKNIDELLDAKGIGPATLEKIKSYVSVGG